MCPVVDCTASCAKCWIVRRHVPSVGLYGVMCPVLDCTASYAQWWIVRCHVLSSGLYVLSGLYGVMCPVVDVPLVDCNALPKSNARSSQTERKNIVA